MGGWIVLAFIGTIFCSCVTAITLAKLHDEYKIRKSVRHIDQEWEKISK